MKHSAVILVLVVMVLVSLATASRGNTCIERNDPCDVQNPQQCCSRYCRAGKCINYGDSKDNDKGPNPCRRINPPCDYGQCCSLHEVQCVRAPCLPIAQCGPCN